MQKELDYLMNYFSQCIADLEVEIEADPTNEFLKGKLQGIKYARVITSMYNLPEDFGHPIDVEID
ncbi:hypothetical protein [Paenibacillus crassostreae]|uniref:Uncharacterized protein n=1 Tax=Paenibacillus crassostreae TaxID=1763538 RepID=A0A162KUL2_9BACL|nr:hypothetical protein [Paenibacillus crassostreae]AOZ94845.1 hypothetical protein LPB68_21480 [Paenibacillus crassostreae]OAB74193.1 hypothetical protein PNBC_12755 [Paenibacillus crassostreae]